MLNSIPDYQARESERIYRGELSVTFTEDMRSTDFSDRTFYVTDLLDNNTMVAGYVSYSPALRKTVFVPMVPFQPNGFYRVEIKTDDENSGERGVHDLAGNPLDNAFMWTFRTTDAPFEPIWSMNFSVTDGTSKDANKYAGVEYGALDEEDEKDARAVPALANQLRMVFLNRNQVQFERDIRPADGRLSHHWFFVILNAQEYAAVTLKWRPSIRLTKTTRQYQVIRLVEFDEYGNVTNTITLDPTEASVNPDTGEIDPVLAYTYVNQGEASRYFRLDVQKVSFVAG
ncbi:MAG: Ig-like domain-containing protein, partial [Candidatus Latescibacteria bacterium]|nr:Ig-like domain-containing protein [Candidatus Latescibacterota bacterium]